MDARVEIRSNIDSYRKLALILAFLSGASVAHAGIHEVAVTGGLIEGVEEQGITAFKGIPFAAPPVGRLRWRPPQPVVSWHGTRKTGAFAQECAQNGGGPAGSSEDCLYLNVWTGAASGKERRPVMVWIPGGGFNENGPAIPVNDGTRFAHAGVVLVSIAYRLGPFGFLAHPDLGSGNYGIEDQIAALKWVKVNIDHFGGDPNRVTIFGASAGAMSVSLLLVSPAARGLFDRAIAESGAMFQPVHHTGHEPFLSLRSRELAETEGGTFFQKLGLTSVDAARAMPTNRLLAASKNTHEFWPVLDGDLLPGDAYSLYEAGRFIDVPILVGSNSDDGADSVLPGITAAAWVAGIGGNMGPEAEAVLAAYPHSADADARRADAEISRDGEFGWAAWTWAKLHSRTSKKHAYLYYFDARPAESTTSEGAAHGAELAYLFGTFGKIGDTSGVGGHPHHQDLELATIMRRYWTNFAARGDPNEPGLPLWPPFSKGNERVLTFDSAPSVRPVPNLDKLEVLDRYFSWRRQRDEARSVTK